MTWGLSDCREGVKRCDKENQRGWGRGELLPPALPPSFSPLSDFALQSTVWTPQTGSVKSLFQCQMLHVLSVIHSTGLCGGEAAKIRYDPAIWQKDRWPPVTYPGWSKLLGCKNEKSVLAKRQIDCYFGVRDFKKYQFAKSACLFWIQLPQPWLFSVDRSDTGEDLLLITQNTDIRSPPTWNNMCFV